MSPRPGIPNNPTGKGGFAPGTNGWTAAGPRKSAARKMIDALSRAASRNDGADMELICSKIMDEAVAGDWEARKFMFDRIVGRAETAVTEKPTAEDRAPAVAEKFLNLIDGLASRRSDETVQ